MPEASKSSSACPFCGYDLAGLSRGQCPECGRPVFRFTNRARAVIEIANARAIDGIGRAGTCWKWWYATSRNPATVKPIHILLGIVAGPEGVGRSVLQQSGASLDEIGTYCEGWTPRMPPVAVPHDARLAPDRRARLVTDAAINAAFELGHDWVGTEHLLLGLIDRGDRMTRKILASCGVRREEVCRLIKENMERIRTEPATPSV